jgi:hypothetical protein
MTAPRLLAALILAACFTLAVGASDPIAVYARVDRVVRQPAGQAPETVQVWGVFSIAVQGNPNDYRPPARGYLYFRVPSNADVARKEWADLNAVAGTGEVVSFGSRWTMQPRVRPADEAPSSPDIYTTNTGLTRVHGNTQYAPIRALLDFKQ